MNKIRAYLHICAAKKCYNSKITHPEKEFFPFPTNVTLCKEWLENCGRTDLKTDIVSRTTGYYRICADHFEDKYFSDCSKNCLDESTIPVPTIFNSAENTIPLLLQPNSCEENEMLSMCPKSEDATNNFEFVLNPTELLVKSESLPISYHSPQITRKEDYEPYTIFNCLLHLNPDTEFFNIGELCRFCMNMSLKHNYVEIFSKSSEASEIRQMCDLVLPKKVTNCDSLPQRICRPCISKLKTCRRIMEQFLYADQYLRTVAKYSLFIENEEFGMSDIDEEECELDNIYYRNQIPKNAMVLPLKDFDSFMESSKNINDASTGQINLTLDQETAACTDLTAVPLQDVKHPPVKQDSSKDSIELICKGVTILQRKETSILNHEKKLNEHQYENEDNLFECVSEKGVESDSDPSQVIISYKCLECFKIYESYSSLFEHVVNIHQEHPPGLNYCSFCEKEFKSALLLKKHNEIEHPQGSYIDYEMMEIGDGKFECTLCNTEGKEYSSKSDLKIHIEEIHACNCEHCDKVFYNQENLEHHFASAHDTRTKCNVCEKEFNSVYRRRTHEMSHTTDCSQVCWICGAILKTKATFKDHMKLHGDTPHTCEICGKGFPTQVKLMKHIKTHTPAVKNLLCHLCPKRFSDAYALRDHIFTHQTIKPFTCEICGNGFNRKRNLLRHDKKRQITGVCPTRVINKKKKRKSETRLELETEIAEFECDVCNRKFFKNRGLKRHRKYHFCNGDPEILKKILNEPEIQKCDICGKLTYSKEMAQIHMKSHTGTLVPFKCEFCDKKVLSYQRLMIHERIHTGERLYKCQYCGIEFREYRTHQAHEIEHTGEQLHICQICAKSFKTRRRLLVHTLIHKDANHLRPYECDLCSRRFTIHRSLLMHMTKYHTSDKRPETDYPCPHCERVFRTKVTRRRHLKKEHTVLDQTEEFEQIGTELTAMEYVTVVDNTNYDVDEQQNLKEGAVIEVDEEQARLEYFTVMENDKNISDFGLQALSYIVSPSDYTI